MKLIIDVLFVAAPFIAGFAAGYGVRSLVSSVRQRIALRSTYGGFTPSHRLQAGVEADNSQLSLPLVPRDDVGDPQSPQHPRIVTQAKV